MFATNYKKLLCFITIGIFLLTIIPNNSAFLLNKESEKQIIIGLSENIDVDFVKYVAREISSVYKNYCRAREYGTEGERVAAKILERIWRDNISDAGIMLDPIRETYFKRNVTDYSLYISDEEIPKSESFPIPSVSEDYNSYGIGLAQVLKIPDFIYRIALSKQKTITPLYKKIYLFNPLIKTFFEKIMFKNIQKTAHTLDVNPNLPSMYWLDYQKMISYKSYDREESVKKVVNTLYDYYDDYDPNIYSFLIPRGIIYTDINKDTVFMNPPYNFCDDSSSSSPLKGFSLPGIVLNASFAPILDDPDLRVSFMIESELIYEIDSYNVIGEILGENDDVIVIGAHYDSWWGQCIIDNAIGVGVVWAIAKYFAENNILPKYTLKFVAFCGEEYGCQGSRYYVDKYIDEENENVRYMINVDTVAYRPNYEFYDKSDLSFNIWQYPDDTTITNKIQSIVNNFNYEDISGGYPISIKGKDTSGIFMTDSLSFAGETEFGVINFDKGNKDVAWHFYHRTGENYTKGDTWDKLDEQDLNACTNVILNIVEKFVND